MILQNNTQQKEIVIREEYVDLRGKKQIANRQFLEELGTNIKDIILSGEDYPNVVTIVLDMDIPMKVYNRWVAKYPFVADYDRTARQMLIEKLKEDCRKKRINIAFAKMLIARLQQSLG